MTVKSGLLFAGQGAQYVGMGRDLADAYPECRELFLKANEILGTDLTRLCFEGPESELVKSNHCQPAIFVVSTACYLAFRKANPAISFDAMAGLSLGEWSALCAAEAVSFEDGLRILEARGRFMQEACEEREGAMLSVIGLSGEQLKRVAETAGVEIANLNSPEQTVLSGDKQSIQQAERLASQAGAKRVVVLNVAGAYHSSLMASAAKRLEAFIQSVDFQVPRIPVISNVTGKPHGTPDAIKRNMVLQVTSPVQWVASLQWLQQQGISRYIECGPGRILSGLVKRIHAGAVLCNVQDRPSLDKTLSVLSSPGF